MGCCTHNDLLVLRRIWVLFSWGWRDVHVGVEVPIRDNCRLHWEGGLSRLLDKMALHAVEYFDIGGRLDSLWVS